VGTLKYFREKYNRKNVTPEKVANSYEGSEQFLLSVGKVYILEAAMKFWGLQNLTDCPSKHVPPPGIVHMTKEKKLDYFNKVIGAFVDEFVTPDPDKENSYAHHENTAVDMDVLEENSSPDRIRYLNSILIISFCMKVYM
jgi:hypothetical protein